MKSNNPLRILLFLIFFITATVASGQEPEWSVRLAISRGFLGVNAGVYADSNLTLARVTGGRPDALEYCEPESLEPQTAAELVEAIRALHDVMPDEQNISIASSCDDGATYYISVTEREANPPLSRRLISLPLTKGCTTPAVMPAWARPLLNILLTLRYVAEMCPVTDEAN